MPTEALAAKYILANNLDASLLTSLCHKVTSVTLLDLARWCLSPLDNDTSDMAATSRLMKLMHAVMIHRPDANEIAHDLFFLRCASMSLMRPVLKFIIQHPRFTHVNDLVLRLRETYRQEDITVTTHFCLDAIHLIQAHHTVDLKLHVPQLPLDRQTALSLADLRRTFCMQQKVGDDHASSYKHESMSINKIDPLSMQAIDEIPEALQFEVDGYYFEIVAFAKYVRLSLDHVKAQYFEPDYFPIHPYTQDVLTASVIQKCRWALAQLWRRHLDLSQT